MPGLSASQASIILISVLKNAMMASFSGTSGLKMSLNTLESPKFGVLITEGDAAMLLGLQLSTLRNYRAPSVAHTQRNGIRWTQIGRKTWYVFADIVAAAERNMREGARIMISKPLLYSLAGLSPLAYRLILFLYSLPRLEHTNVQTTLPIISQTLGMSNRQTHNQNVLLAVD